MRIEVKFIVLAKLIVVVSDRLRGSGGYDEGDQGVMKNNYPK